MQNFKDGIKMGISDGVRYCYLIAGVYGAVPSVIPHLTLGRASSNPSPASVMITGLLGDPA